MCESLVFGRRRAENEYVGIMDRRSPRVEKHLHSAMKQEEQKNPKERNTLLHRVCWRAFLPVHTKVELFLRRHQKLPFYQICRNYKFLGLQRSNGHFECCLRNKLTSVCCTYQYFFISLLLFCF